MRTTSSPDEQSPLLQNDTTLKPSPPKHQDLHGKTLYLTLLFPYLASLLAAIDTTLTSTCAGAIASSFSSLALISWLGSAYLIGVAAIQPIAGKLTDRYGRRSGCLLSLLTFAAGNVACGLAGSVPVLVLGRVVAGLGAGGMNATCTFVINDSVGLRRRGVWQGVGNIVWAAGIGLGAVVGGAVNDWVGWRYGFLGLAPVTAVVFVGVAVTVREGAREKSVERLDGVGVVLLTGGVVAVVTGFNLIEGGRDWTVSGVLVGVSAVLLGAFVVNELRFAKDPVLPIRLLRDGSVWGVCAAAFFLSASFHSLLFYVPILIQVRGYSTSQVGLQLLGEVVGASTGSFATGLVMKAVGGYTLLKPLVFVLYLAAPLAFFLSHLDWPVWTTVLSLVVMGSGIGSSLTVLITGILAVTDQAVQAPVMSLLYAFRQVGASSGLAASGVLFRALLGDDFGGHASTDPVDDIASRCNLNEWDGAVRPRICDAYGHSLHFVFLFALIMGAISFASSLMLRNESLDREAGEQVEGIGPENARSDSDV